MRLGRGLLLAVLLSPALPVASGEAGPLMPQTMPVDNACPDAVQRNQCRQRCSPVRMIFQPCAGTEDEDPATCRDEAIGRCLEECLARQCRAG